MEDCIFCKIVSGEIPSCKVYEDEFTCGFDGVNLLNASDESAGQSVQHFHIHIIPRKKGDGIDAWPVFHGSKAEIEEMYERLRMQ